VTRAAPRSRLSRQAANVPPAPARQAGCTERALRAELPAPNRLPWGSRLRSRRPGPPADCGAARLPSSSRDLEAAAQLQAAAEAADPEGGALEWGDIVPGALVTGQVGAQRTQGRARGRAAARSH
jgi:hypothetical protein